MGEIILTEKRNPDTVNIDLLSSQEIVRLINNEDLKVALAVQKELDSISKAVDLITESFLKGGNLLYFGAGTSGRLGILDASECPPTFSVLSEMVRGYIAGGDTAIKNAVEGAEDSFEGGESDFVKSGAEINDVVVGISASGNAPYVIGVLKKAKELGISTIGIACNKKAKLQEHADIFISPEVGEEAITGSTRMKAGTAQKMILNMLSTASMIKIGKTYENFMIDVKPTNIKLKDRAARIVSEIAEVDYENAKNTLIKADYNVKAAVLMLKYDINFNETVNLLNKNNGRLRETLNKLY
ncbi:MAG: N-acetylmuramic acid 6-phosphate etherase [Candidatus Gastranaerophilales bacterium]|nr:N-acetylmuramic acid 6-phosphate etherase [Candidatus Gastranaerophilales bacterium]